MYLKIEYVSEGMPWIYRCVAAGTSLAVRELKDKYPDASDIKVIRCNKDGSIYKGRA